MTADHGRPSAAELVAAVAEFLESDVRAATGDDVAGRGEMGRVNFHARVAANVLRIVERELGDGADDSAAGWAGPGVSDEAQLAAAIRDGRLDDRADDVLPALRRSVLARLNVAHPGYGMNSLADRLFAAMRPATWTRSPRCGRRTSRSGRSAPQAAATRRGHGA